MGVNEAWKWNEIQITETEIQLPVGRFPDPPERLYPDPRLGTKNSAQTEKLFTKVGIL